ncbi:arsenic resistance protein ArsH [Alteromonas sp. V450]|uniref:arsenate reductase family protein n=1 Tax=Alteromonas sp. V450 TaxID=1912139 RepID=UPI0008FF5224|nr:arsenate reductase family protein [Alteromonas sp. V450]OJF67648.1 arsenic resistance protein ArsH [Alteromonas sp. V450]
MIKIYHNPECGTSRNVLAVIKAAGYEVQVIEYLHVGWEREQLTYLLNAANLSPRQALRTSKSPAAELGLLDEAVSNETIFEMMLKHPILVNRPIVCIPQDEYEHSASLTEQLKKGKTVSNNLKETVKLCRPSEVVLDILPIWPQGPFAKEDGTSLIDQYGRRVI